MREIGERERKRDRQIGRQRDPDAGLQETHLNNKSTVYKSHFGSIFFRIIRKLPQAVRS